MLTVFKQGGCLKEKRNLLIGLKIKIIHQNHELKMHLGHACSSPGVFRILFKLHQIQPGHLDYCPKCPSLVARSFQTKSELHHTSLGVYWIASGRFTFHILMSFDYPPNNPLKPPSQVRIYARKIRMRFSQR